MPRLTTVHVPRFLVPVLGGVAALAIGVGAAFVAASVTAPTQVSQRTVTLPVAGALGTDGKAAETGTRLATSPQAKSTGSHPALDAVLHRLADGETAQHAVADLGAPPPSPPATPTPPGDPCSPASGSPGSGCPGGIHGAILSDTATPDLIVGGQAQPPTLAQFTAHGNPVGSIWCPAATRTATSMPIGIFSTLPANVTYSYWPTADSSSTRSGESDSSSTEISRFRDDLAANVAPGALPISQHCATLSGLTPNTGYTVLISATDYLGRSAQLSTFLFNSGGAPVRPTVSFVALGPSAMSGQGFHTPGQTLQMKAWIVPTGTAPTCPIAGAELTEYGAEEGSVDANYLNDHNYLPSYTQTSVAGWLVPAGANVLFCARWYNAGSSHSWERDQPIYQVQQLIQAPSRLLRTVSVLSTTPGADTSASREFTITTVGGNYCGSLELGGAAAVSLPAVACSPTAVDVGDVSFVEGVGWVDGSHRGGNYLDLTVTASEPDGDEHATNSMTVLDATNGCYGVCAVPAPERYSIDFLDSAGHPDGSATYLVSWGSISTSYSGADWGIGVPSASSPGYVQPDLPQMDTQADFRIQATDLVRHNVTAGFTLSVDRPVDYTVRLIDAGGGPVCVRPGGTATISGHTSDTVPISFSDLCLGGTYQAEVDLTDTRGRQARWGLTDRATWWQNGQFTTPLFTGDIRYQWGAFGPAQASLPRISIAVDNNDLHAVNGRGGQCISDGVAFGTGTVPATLSENSTVFVTMTLSHSDRWTPTSCPPDTDSEVNVTIPVTLSDLTRPEGARVTIPSADGFYVNLWVDPASY